MTELRTVDFLSTTQVGIASGQKPNTVGEYDRIGVLSPVRIGTRTRLWNRQQCLAVTLANLLMRAGMSGQPIYGAMRLIAENSLGELHRIYETTPLIAVVPGVAVVAEWVGREQFEELAWELLDTFQVHPLGIDIEKMHKRMEERIEAFERLGWKVQESEEAVA